MAHGQATMRDFRRALRASVGRVCAFQIHDGCGAALVPLLTSVIRGERVHDDDIREAMGGNSEAHVAPEAGPTIIPGSRPGRATALLSVRGIALYDVEYQPLAFSTLLLSQTIGQLAGDPEISRIVLDFDTPGGQVTGTPEAADAIFAARQNGTKVTALINPLAASAGYWLASQASEIISIPSGDAGSVGVFLAHMNCAGLMEQMGVEPSFIFAGKYKVEGNAFEQLSADAREFYQGEVDSIYRDFLKAVARGRGRSVQEVEENFGQGRTFMAPVAKRAGMIDKVQPVDTALANLGINNAPTQSRRRGEAQAHEAMAPTPGEQANIETPEAEPTFWKTFDGAGNEKGVCVAEDWPQTTQVHRALVSESEHIDFHFDCGSEKHMLTMTVDNGWARYEVTEQTDDWLACRLIDSEFTPHEQHSKSDSGEADAEPPDAPDAGKAARQRRLAVLRA